MRKTEKDLLSYVCRLFHVNEVKLRDSVTRTNVLSKMET